MLRTILTLLTIAYCLIQSTIQAIEEKKIPLKQALKMAYLESEEIELNKLNFLTSIHAKHEVWTKFLPDIKVTSLFSYKVDFSSKDQTLYKDPMSSARPYISLQQNLFRGGQDLTQLRMVVFSLHKASFDYKISEQEIILKMIEAYIDYIYSQQYLKISLKNLASYSTKLDAVSERYKHGEGTLVDMEMSKASYAKAQQERYSAEHNLENAKSKFFLYFKFWPKNLEIPNLSLKRKDNIASTTDKILKSNLQTKSALKDMHSTKYEVYNSKLRFLPNVDLGFRYQFSNNSIIGSNPINKMDVSIDIPILRAGGADFVNVKKMNKKLSFKKNQYLKVSKEISDQIKSKLEEFNNLIEKIKANQAAIKSSKISVEAMNQEYVVGTRTLIDVLNEQEKLNKYLIEDINLNKNFIMSYYMLKALEGNLLMIEIDQENASSYFDPNKHIK